MTAPLRRLTLIPVLALVVGACGGDEETGVTAPEYLAFRDQPTACGAEQPEPVEDLQFEAPEDLSLSGTVDVVLHTSCGPIDLRLDANAAPATVNSFVFLARQGFFEGSAAHRVVPGFVMQAGDPTASGSGGPGYPLPDEFPPADFSYVRGTVAMANSGFANSGGSQFFIVLEDVTLAPTFTVFGEVTNGFDVLDTIASLPMGPNLGDSIPSRPQETVYLERVEIVG
jgi:peptidylprolyl isomerase